MKKYIVALALMAFVISANAQQYKMKRDTSQAKNCYEQYYEAFITRGALDVPDGEHNVVVSLRTDTGCFCGQGKITVKDGRIIPSLLVKKEDGTYEPARRQLHPKMTQGNIVSQNQDRVYKGMSQTFMTYDNELADLFFIDFLKRKVVPNAQAPSPDEIAGVQIELNEKEKDIVQKAYDGLQFDNAKSTIKPSSYPHLNLLASMLMEKPDYKLRIKGYTDNVGNEEFNLKLSKDRAESVKKYLINKGMDATKISAEGFGMQNPIADNATAEGRAKNRRVEFIVVQ